MMRPPVVFESIQDLASIKGPAEVRIRICRVLHRISALLDSTLLMKSDGASGSAVIALPSTHLLPNNSRRVPHRRHESVFGIASVSSYGHVIDSGSTDPFNYGLPSLRERERLSSEDMSSISMSMTVDDTFAFIRNQPRRRVDSNASSFYFCPSAPAPGARGHRRRESNVSVSSQAPPISLYNRSFGQHRRNDSSASASSVAMSYAKYGANSGISTWARHCKDLSMDSVMSDFSAVHPGRPGLGDKMFENAAYHGPLTSISTSPRESDASQRRFGRRNSFDSIMDEEQRFSMEDSIFEKTGQPKSIIDGINALFFYCKSRGE